MIKNQGYTAEHLLSDWSHEMPKRKNPTLTTFGTRLAQLRKAAGYTQAELANEVGVSRRMITYYESQGAHPPTHLLTLIAGALHLTTDALLGATPIKRAATPRNSRLQRRLQQIERLEPAEKRQVLQVLDAFIERGQLKRKAG
jgi:transcriptional regulator with XRE-family HTH domain